MAVHFTLPTVLAHLADGHHTVQADGQTLAEAVDHVAKRFPRLASRLRDEDGNPYPFVSFYLNNRDIRFAGGFAVEVADGDEVTVVPAIAGG
jgi:molybdopterin synthase sulfur carrier subunit